MHTLVFPSGLLKTSSQTSVVAKKQEGQTDMMITGICVLRRTCRNIGIIKKSSTLLVTFQFNELNFALHSFQWVPLK